MLAWNLNRGISDVRLFEIGNIFFAPAEERAEEREAICLGVTGNAIEAGVHGVTRPFNFFDFKGDIETLLHAFEIGILRFEPTEHYHPGRSAQAVADGKIVARFGQVHPDLTAKLKIKQDIYLAEISLHQLLQLPLRIPRYQPLSRFPAVDRDFSFIFSETVKFQQIESSVQALKIVELKSFKPVEIFRGGAVGQGKYSVLLRAEFQSAERTLRDDEVAQWSAQIVKSLEILGGSLRS
jgi:phenylalanyl-tRNA synthetase beta chain